MAGKRIAVLVASVFLSICAVAQRNEFAATFGESFSPGATGVPSCEALLNCPATGHVDVGFGFTVGATFAHRFADFKAASLWLELPVVVVPSRSGPGIIAQPTFSTVFFTPSLKAQFAPKAAISPFLSVGAGLAHYSGQGSATPWAAQFGGGLDFKTRIPHLGFRVEARDFINGQPKIGALSAITSGHLQQVFAGGGVVFKF
jgi:hypothetical protein